MAQQLYFNGDPVEAPALTPLEKRLARQLSLEDYGDSDPEGFITVSDSEWCYSGGLERVNMIKWEGGRKQLDRLLTRLQKKRLIVIDDPEDEYGLELWFDCEVLAMLAE